MNKQRKDALPHLLNSAKSTQDVSTYASNSEAECLSYPDFECSLMDYPSGICELRSQVLFKHRAETTAMLAATTV